jgi:hypothetical protein
VDRIETIEEGRVARVVEAPPPESRPSRTVVVALDAVPYAAEVYPYLGLRRAPETPVPVVDRRPAVSTGKSLHNVP